MPPRKPPPQPPDEEPEEPREESEEGEQDIAGQQQTPPAETAESTWGDWRRPLPPAIPDISELDTAVLSTQEVLHELELQRQREIGYHDTQARSLHQAAAALDADIRRARALEAALAERYRLVLLQPPRSVAEMALARQWLEELGAGQLALTMLEQEQATLRGQADAHERAASALRRVKLGRG